MHSFVSSLSLPVRPYRRSLFPFDQPQKKHMCALFLRFPFTTIPIQQSKTPCHLPHHSLQNHLPLLCHFSFHPLPFISHSSSLHCHFFPHQNRTPQCRFLLNMNSNTFQFSPHNQKPQITQCMLYRCVRHVESVPFLRFIRACDAVRAFWKRGGRCDKGTVGVTRCRGIVGGADEAE